MCNASPALQTTIGWLCYVPYSCSVDRFDHSVGVASLWQIWGGNPPADGNGISGPVRSNRSPSTTQLRSKARQNTATNVLDPPPPKPLLFCFISSSSQTRSGRIRVLLPWLVPSNPAARLTSPQRRPFPKPNTAHPLQPGRQIAQPQPQRVTQLMQRPPITVQAPALANLAICRDILAAWDAKHV